MRKHTVIEYKSKVRDGVGSEQRRGGDAYFATLMNHPPDDLYFVTTYKPEENMTEQRTAKNARFVSAILLDERRVRETGFAAFRSQIPDGLLVGLEEALVEKLTSRLPAIP